MSEGYEDLSRETLNAYADGELSPSDMTRIATLLEKHPDLRAYVESQERLRHRLQVSFAPVMNEPVPERLRQLVDSFAGKTRAGKFLVRDRLREHWTWNVIGPAFAALAVGLLVGIVIQRFEPESGPFIGAGPNGEILARGELAHALDDRLASNASASDVVRVGLSFRSKQRRDCRTFEWATGSVSTSGVACHFVGGWHLAALVSEPRPADDAAAYRTAGAEMPDAIRGIVSAMISGQPFDPSAERAARASHWAGAGQK